MRAVRGPCQEKGSLTFAPKRLFSRRVLVVFNRNERDCLTLRSVDGSGMAWEKAPVDITPQLTNASGSLTTGPSAALIEFRQAPISYQDYHM